MAKGKTSKPKPQFKVEVVHTCEECRFHEWFKGDPGDNWNCNIQTGEAITMHCIRDKQNIIKGIWKGTKACANFEK